MFLSLTLKVLGSYEPSWLMTSPGTFKAPLFRVLRRIMEKRLLMSFYRAAIVCPHTLPVIHQQAAAISGGHLYLRLSQQSTYRHGYRPPWRSAV